jgi:hypothetical protein
MWSEAETLDRVQLRQFMHEGLSAISIDGDHLQPVDGKDKTLTRLGFPNARVEICAVATLPDGTVIKAAARKESNVFSALVNELRRRRRANEWS